MKQLSIEQKAKRYDEAIGTTRKLVGAGLVYEDAAIQIFPELRESEGERTRKELLSVVNDLVLPDEQQSRFVAWLEKQGEHANFRSKIQIGDKVTRNDSGVLVNLSQFERVVNKVEKQEQKPVEWFEPKFHEGEWIVRDNDGFTISIESIRNKTHYYFHRGGNLLAEVVDESYHLWTIDDAKDGDVLASKEGDDILIFRKIEDNVSFSSYYNIAKKVEHYWSKNRFIPATKEQREELEKAMADAGWEFDFEKKELKKIEYASETMNEKDAIDNGFTEMMLKEQKPVEWSEDDELRINSILSSVRYCNEQYPDKKEYIKDIIWLNLLKDRVIPQPKQEWSEDDVKTLAKMMFAFKTMVLPSADECNKFIEFFKSIRDKGSL